MKESQPLNNSQWIAHDTNNESVFELTLRVSLLQCKAAYIMEEVLVLDIDDDLNELHLINKYSDDIPSHIKFVVVELVPNFSTETP